MDKLIELILLFKPGRADRGCNKTHFEIEQMNKSTLLIGIVGAVLVVTNPDKSDFIRFMNTRITSAMKEKSPKEEEAVTNFASGLVTFALEKSTERKNYTVLSLYEVDTSFLRVFNGQVPNLNFIGVAGNILPTPETYKVLEEFNQNR